MISFSMWNWPSESTTKSISVDSRRRDRTQRAPSASKTSQTPENGTSNGQQPAGSTRAQWNSTLLRKSPEKTSNATTVARKDTSRATAEVKKRMTGS